MGKVNSVNDTTGIPYWKERRMRDPERMTRIRRKHELKKKYNMTPDDWEDMYQDQSGCCATCGLALAYCLNVCVDHCHKSGVVRGILCGRCNKALGLLDDSPETLKNMIEYLRGSSNG